MRDRQIARTGIAIMDLVCMMLNPELRAFAKRVERVVDLRSLCIAGSSVYEDLF